jgi:hypothetical protein
MGQRGNDVAKSKINHFRWLVDRHGDSAQSQCEIDRFISLTTVTSVITIAKRMGKLHSLRWQTFPR